MKLGCQCQCKDHNFIHNQWAALRIFANQIDHDLWLGIPISCLLTMGGCSDLIVLCLNRFLGVKVLVAAFNKEKALI